MIHFWFLLQFLAKIDSKMSSTGTADELSTQGWFKEQKSLLLNFKKLAISKSHVDFLRCCEINHVIPENLLSLELATIDRKENEEMVRILSVKIKRLKDALCKKLEKEIYDSLILKLKLSLQCKLKAKKIENLKKIEGLKLKEINYTEDSNHFEKIDVVVEPLKQKKKSFWRKGNLWFLPLWHLSQSIFKQNKLRETFKNSYRWEMFGSIQV